MEFIDTIAALATPPGVGGIAIIRISGKEAVKVASKIFSGPVEKFQSHTAHLGVIKNKEGKKIDDALLLVMKAPKSYTGEDIVEIQCHGGSISSSSVLQATLDHGARIARPGEFTFRAFMNGKVDLAQAEAVQNLIGAKSEVAFANASSQLSGALSQKILHLNQEILFLAALFEAWVDFPEEGLEFSTMEEAAQKLEKIIGEMERLLDTYENGEKIHQGITMCIVGAPNVGKSSLMNVLLGKEKAIVTPIAGTTRDLIEGDFQLNGLYFRLIDTAGIRETDEIIEQEGIRRSHQAFEKADLVLLVLDSQKGVIEEEKFLSKLPKEKTIAIWNKNDLVGTTQPLSFHHVVSISAKNRQGIELLQKKIEEVALKKDFSKEEVMLTSLRHSQAIVASKDALKRALAELQNKAYQEVLALELRDSLNELGKILGTNVTEDILSSIFSTFCIGK